MHAKHYFPEGDHLGRFMKTKIAVVDRHLIFPKLTAKECPLKLMKELMDVKNESPECDYQGMSLKVTISVAHAC